MSRGRRRRGLLWASRNAMNALPMLRSSAGTLGRSATSWRRRAERTRLDALSWLPSSSRVPSRFCSSSGSSSRCPALGALLHSQPPCLRRARRTRRLPGRSARQCHLLGCAGLPIGHPAENWTNADAQFGGHVADGIGREHTPQTRCRHPLPRSHASNRDPSTSRPQGHASQATAVQIRSLTFGPVGNDAAIVQGRSPASARVGVIAPRRVENFPNPETSGPRGASAAYGMAPKAAVVITGMMGRWST